MELLGSLWHIFFPGNCKEVFEIFYFHEILHKADYLCVIPKMNIMIFILFISENPAKVLIWKMEGIQKEK